MIRHVSVAAVAVCLTTSVVGAQTVEPQRTELTVKIAPANVHKFPSVGSPVIGKAQIGTVLEIRRDLGSMVEVPWPGGENGLAFVHVNSGSINRRSTPVATSTGQAAATPMPAAASPMNAASRDDRMPPAAVPGAPRRTYVVLPSHIVGLGGQLTASAAGFGGTARAWWGNRLGVQFALTRSRLDNIDAATSMTSLQFAPSVLYAFPDAVSNDFWVRPYAGGGSSFSRTTLSTGTTGIEEPAAEKGLAFRAFGGVEATFSGMPQFSLSADLGRSWREKSYPGFESHPIEFSVSAHWYVK